MKSRLTLIGISTLIIGIAGGLGFEAYKHSDGYIRNRFDEMQQSYTAVSEYLDESKLRMSISMTEINDDFSSSENYVSLDYFKDSEIYDDLIILRDGGLDKITSDSSAVWFYNDLKTGCCYVKDPEKAFDDIDNKNHIEGNFYKFNLNKKA